MVECDKVQFIQELDLFMKEILYLLLAYIYPSLQLGYLLLSR